MERQRLGILLVDDDEEEYLITRDLFAEIEGIRCDLEWVATYDAALHAINRQEHDVYLLDYRLGSRTEAQASATIETLYPEGPRLS